ncbi:hypothetical protein NSS71_08765 [Niallia sp. FSL W8-0951]|uniref:homing endonuclease associated repeat-containing protein n=1 Tax=Niallia sp. FSL W8-0951 TaxID=2954639 RepID=UPI0030F50589
MANLVFTEEDLLTSYKTVYDYYGRQPSYNEYRTYAKENNLPSLATIKYRFTNFMNINKILGFPLKPNKTKYTKEFLIKEIKRFNDEFGRPPISKDFDIKNRDYPSRKCFVSKFGSFGNALVAAGFPYRSIENFQVRNKPLPKNIAFTKNTIKICIEKYIDDYGEIPTLSKLEKLPGYPIRSDFRRLFGGFNEAIIEMGYKPKHTIQYTDEQLEIYMRKFVDEFGRSPTLQEFNNSDYPSFWCYQNRFGSWTNALKHYGLETFITNIEKLKEDIIQLCNAIYENEGRRIITYQDIAASDVCASISTYTKHFREDLGMTVRDFIKSIGFEAPKSSMGMYYEFKDGEETFSNFEYKTSTYLREKGYVYNSSYFRSVKYNRFIEEYTGNKDCDYLVIHNGVKYYIEVAGMMDRYKTNLINKIEVTYNKRMHEKEIMLINSGVNYLFIYPNDFKEKSLDEIFSFLHS